MRRIDEVTELTIQYKVYEEYPNEEYMACENIDCGLAIFKRTNNKRVFICECVRHLIKNREE